MTRLDDVCARHLRRLHLCVVAVVVAVGAVVLVLVFVLVFVLVLVLVHDTAVAVEGGIVAGVHVEDCAAATTAE